MAFPALHVRALTPSHTHSRDRAKTNVGDKGNQVVRDHLASALENCKIPGVQVSFRLCNLSAESVQLLANALERNTTIVEFTCEENPFNYPNGVDYDPRTDEMVKRAIIKTQAPITKWNGKPLPQDVVESKKPQAVEVAPTPEKLANVNRVLSAARKTFSEEGTKLDRTTAERDSLKIRAAQSERDLTAHIARVERELQTLKRQKDDEMRTNTGELTKLNESITKSQLEVQRASAVIKENEAYLTWVEGWKRRHQHLFVGETPAPVASPPSEPDDSAVCGICMVRPKNCALYKCGHRVCKECADAIKKSTGQCPYCKGPIMDVMRIY